MRFRTLLFSALFLGGLSLSPQLNVVEAQQMCNCPICGCFRIHWYYGDCSFPNIEPCDCWRCMGGSDD